MTGPSIYDELVDMFGSAIQTAFPDASHSAIVTQCDPKFGDYQCNSAMALFKQMKGKEGAPKNPRAAADMIIDAVKDSPIIASTSVAGPGFVNIKLSPDWVAGRLGSMMKNGIQSWAPKPPKSKIVVDFSSPNVAKEMHVGHLRSTIIGDTLAKTFEFAGADVLRLNHIGDWGTQFGMLIEYMAEKRPEGLGKEGGKEEDVADLQDLYRAAKAKFDNDEEFKTKARAAVKLLQGGAPEYLSAWNRICDASRKQFEQIYGRLGVTLTERGESFYNPYLAPLVEELMESGVAEESQGATCVFVEGQKVPLIIRKSDGGFGYATTDMAALRQRLNEEKAEWVIYVTDVGQSQHFQMIFAGAKKAGWISNDPDGARVDHVGFGLVLGEDGQKFKARSGDVVRLVDLLDEAKTRCSTTIKERREERGEPISDEELERAASIMGYGAVKYADLKNNRMSNYKFSYDEMLSLKGNTAVYLLYAYARICGIVRKSGKDVGKMKEEGKIVLEHEKEYALGLHLSQFPEALDRTMSELMPNRLCEYLYDLSDIFTGFYTECNVVGSEQEESRLLLCEATATVIRQCFALLGITPMERI
ncbi:hypothetical protein BSKO_05268 [Bryopsis sp. KO-2023]|nr:hypothetical protein BSKO_05268 [Bryopsis sp. KO-2023]